MTAHPLIPGTQVQQVSVDGLLSKKMQNLGSGQPLYIGEAPPGSGTAEAKWRIRKLEYDNGNNFPPTGELFASGSNDFDKKWTLRTTYSYS